METQVGHSPALLRKSNRSLVRQGQRCGEVKRQAGLGQEGSLNSRWALGFYSEGNGERLKSVARKVAQAPVKRRPSGWRTPQRQGGQLLGCCNCLGDLCPSPAYADNCRNPRDTKTTHVQNEKMNSKAEPEPSQPLSLRPRVGRDQG